MVEGARAIGFGLGIPGPSDFGVVDGILVDRAFHDERRDTALEIATVDELANADSAPRTPSPTCSPPPRSPAHGVVDRGDPARPRGVPSSTGTASSTS